jgi:hypothetical protein
MSIQQDMFLNKVATIKIRSGFSLQGIVIGNGSSWFLIRYIPADYVIDGYAFINKKYILNVDISEDDIFTETILKLRKCDFDSVNDFDLDNTEHLLLAIGNTNRLIGITLKKAQSQYIGSIRLVREKSMKVHLIDKFGNWLTEENFLYKELRAVYINNV